MRHLRVVLAAMLAALPAPAFAWNDLGHMTVAATAWARMTHATKTRASALLKFNPQYDGWVEGVAPDQRDVVAFLKAATWPDQIKDFACPKPPRAPTPGCYVDTGYRPVNPSEDLNIGYADRDLRRYWHFKNVGFSNDGTPLQAPFAVDAETQIGFFTASIADPTLNSEARSFDFAWLLHLVGDIHQPLHAVARFTANDTNGDSGANNVSLCPPAGSRNCPESQRRTLHSYWDGALGGSRDPRKALKIAQHYADFVAADADRTAPPAVWVEESVAAAKRYAYARPIGPRTSIYSIRQNSTYARNTGSTAEQRMRLAGIRLAEILNSKLI